MGCGRVGASLSDGLARIGHEVAVIDRDGTAFHRLSPEFPGERVLGMGFDRDVLLRAGIEEAGAFAAVSSGDNSNIISARVARETFGVRKVRYREELPAVLRKWARGKTSVHADPRSAGLARRAVGARRVRTRELKEALEISSKEGYRRCSAYALLYLGQVHQMKEEGKINIASHLKGKSDLVIKRGIDNAGVFHLNRSVAKNKKGNIITQDLSLLYYYHNRLVGYDLEQFI